MFNPFNSIPQDNYAKDITIFTVIELLCVLHFLLLKSIPRVAATACIVLASITLPDWTDLHNTRLPMVLFSFNIYVLLRVLDAGLVPPQQFIEKLRFSTYIEYILSWDTTLTRSLKAARLKQKSASGKGGSDSEDFIGKGIPPNRRNVTFYVKLFLEYILTYLGYNFIKWYYYAHPDTLDRQARVHTLLDLSNLGLVRTALLFFFHLYCLLYLVYTPVFMLLSIGFKVPFQPLMKAPWLATSPRDFWSNRWNSMIKEILHRLAFQPTLALLDYLTGFEAHAKKRNGAHLKRPYWNYIISSMSAFLMSIALHEWMVYVLLEAPTTLEQAAFFSVHFLATVLEVMLLKLVIGKWRSNIGQMKILTYPIRFCGTVLTIAFFLWTAPLFANPWIREDLLLKVKLPLLF